MLQIGDGQSFRQKRTGASEGDEPVRLNCETLIEFWGKSEIDFDDVGFGEPVKRMTFPSECRISLAIRLAGVRGLFLCRDACQGQAWALRRSRRCEVIRGR